MYRNFEEFPEPPRSSLRELFGIMNEFREKLSQLSARLDSSRNEYKQKINIFFQQKPPFPTYGEIEDDVDMYTKLISYCLDAGDSDLLEIWGINRVLEAQGNTLASDDYELYSLTFNTARQNSQTSLEEECWIKLIKLFYLLQNPGDAAKLEKSYKN